MKIIAVKKNRYRDQWKNPCIFYNCSPSISSAKNNNKKKEHKSKTTDKNTDLIEGLSCLGLDGISNSQVEAALKKCFPNGVGNVEEGEILRQVYVSN